MVVKTDREIETRTEVVQPAPAERVSGRAFSIRWAVIPLLILDAACVAFSMWAAYQIRFQVMAYYAVFDSAFYQRLVWIGIPIYLIIFALYHLYHPDRLFHGMQEYIGAINACTASLVALVLYSFLNRQVEHDISRGWLAIVWFLSIDAVVLSRFAYRRVIYRLREKRKLFVERALIVGANEEGEAVASQLKSTPASGIEIVGFVDPVLEPGDEVNGLEVLGAPRDLSSLILRLGIDDVIVIPTALRREELLDLYRDWGNSQQVKIQLSSGLYELFTTGLQVREFGFIPLFSLNKTRITGLDAWLKAAVDYVGAFIALVLLSPLLLAVGLVIWIDSGGPVIYRRRVVGLQGKRFDAYKFRTMIPEAEFYLQSDPKLREQWEENGKIEEDPRITRIGRFLRRYSIDELPQLFNVLRGEMSLVGPRMITPEELQHFGRWRHNLLTVKPGMTGLWQISGRADLSYEDRVRLDMQYIRNYTIWMDFRLLIDTLQAVIQGEGAR